MREQPTPTVLFIHGIRNDDPDKQWHEALEAALTRAGRGTLAGAGFASISPTWLRRLEGAEPTVDPGPPDLTYVRDSDDAYQRSAGEYYLCQSSLESVLTDTASTEAGLMSSVPATPISDVVVPRLFKDVEAYCKSARRRNACLRAVLGHIPQDGEILVIAHSLGSVLAADLLYALPPRTRVRLLVTIGSPLALPRLRDHLRRLRDRFPFERVGPWLNVVGVADPVTAGRGINSVFPEVLDRFVDTGKNPKPAHQAVAYLDQDVIARAIRWVFDDDMARSEPTTKPEIAVSDEALRSLALDHYALIVEQKIARDVRLRFGPARKLLVEERRRIVSAIPEAKVLADRLGRNNSELLRGRIPPEAATGVLLAACMGNPIAPYEIEFDTKAEAAALTRLAQDLGFPRSRAEKVLEAEREARRVHRVARPQKWAFLAVGAAALVAAPWLVVAAAPAGIAGGAAIVAGLAALGPGGMVGGLGVVGLVGGAGGAAVAQGLTAGSVQTVEQNVLYFHALAIAGRDLHEPDHAARVWPILVAMEAELASERARLARFSDPRAAVLGELDRKLKPIRRALDWLSRNGLGPRALPS